MAPTFAQPLTLDTFPPADLKGLVDHALWGADAAGDAMVAYLTRCCGASVTGTSDGVACRACYKLLPDAAGMAWSLHDAAMQLRCATCNDILHCCPTSPLRGKGTDPAWMSD